MPTPPRRPCAYLAPLIFLLLVPAARAQCPGQFTPTGSLPGVDGTQITSMVEWDQDGPGPIPAKLLVSGNFTHAGPLAAAGMALWTGSNWEPFPAPLRSAASLIIFNGELIATNPLFAGTPAPNPSPTNAILRWDGAAWQPMGAGLASPVSILGTYNGELFAGGQGIVRVSTTAPFTYAPLARWTGTTWQLFTGPNGPTIGSTSGTIGTVQALKEFNGQLFVGGANLINSSQGTPEVVAWDGSSWINFPIPGVWSSPATTYCFANYNNKLYAGRNAQSNLSAVLSFDGTAWQSENIGLGPNAGSVRVYSLQELNGNLYAAGDFITADINRNSSYNLVRINATGWECPSDYSYGNYPILSMSIFNNRLILGSQTTDGRSAPIGISSYDGSTFYGLTEGFDGIPYTATTTDTGLFVGGGFRSRAGVPLNGGTIFDGNNWTPLNNGPLFLPSASTFHNGSLYVGGRFPDPDSNNNPRVLRWDGSTWSSLGGTMTRPTPGPLFIQSVAFYNGDLIAAGFFTSAGGTPANSIARWDGAAWQPLADGLDGLVNALTVHDNLLIAAGNFSHSGSTSLSRIAAWNGTSWSPLADGFTDGQVFALSTYQGDLIAGGLFLNSGTTPLQHVARWDGAAWHNMGAGVPGSVTSFANYDHRLFTFSQLQTSPFTNSIDQWDGRTWSNAVSDGLIRSSAILTPFGSDLLIFGPTLSYSATFTQTCGPICATADFNNDGDSGTDQDIEAFFACLAGTCCPTCWHLGADFNADGDTGTDADIEAFFRVLAGGPC